MFWGAFDFLMTGEILPILSNFSRPSMSSSSVSYANRALNGTEETKSIKKRSARYLEAIRCGFFSSLPVFVSKKVVLNSKMMSIRKSRSTMASEHLMKSLSMKPGFG